MSNPTAPPVLSTTSVPRFTRTIFCPPFRARGGGGKRLNAHRPVGIIPILPHRQIRPLARHIKRECLRLRQRNVQVEEDRVAVLGIPSDPRRRPLLAATNRDRLDEPIRNRGVGADDARRREHPRGHLQRPLVLDRFIRHLALHADNAGAGARPHAPDGRLALVVLKRVFDHRRRRRQRFQNRRLIRRGDLRRPRCSCKTDGEAG